MLALSEAVDAVEADQNCVVTVDLGAREVRAGGPASGPSLITVAFEIDDYTRWRLMEGLDDISLTLRHADDITGFERSRADWLPSAAQAR